VKLESLKLFDGLQWFFGPRWRHDFASSLKKSFEEVFFKQFFLKTKGLDKISLE